MREYALRLMLFIVCSVATAAVAQGTTQPAQPVDPTAQSPEAPAGSTPPTFPDSGVSTKSPEEDTAPATSAPSGRTASQSQPFKGMVIQRKGNFILRSGDLEYKLDDRRLAKKYEGKYVRVSGELDKQSNTIRVKTMDLAPES